jgi:hypothetical protein
MHGDCVPAFPSWLHTQCRNLCAWDPFAHRCRSLLMPLVISFIVNALHLSANSASTCSVFLIKDANTLSSYSLLRLCPDFYL